MNDQLLVAAHLEPTAVRASRAQLSAVLMLLVMQVLPQSSRMELALAADETCCHLRLTSNAIPDRAEFVKAWGQRLLEDTGTVGYSLSDEGVQGQVQLMRQ